MQSTSTIQETTTLNSFSTIPSTVSKVVTTTESLGRDIDRSTTRDQRATMELESDKKDDVYVGIEDSKLNTVLSTISLTISLALTVAVFILAVPVLLYKHKKEDQSI